MTEKALKYDGTFMGFLSCVFYAYEQKLKVAAIIPPGEDQAQLFCETEEVYTEESKSLRVLKGLKSKVSISGLTRIRWAFLSEEAGVEMKLFEMIKYIFSKKGKVDTDYTHPAVLEITQISKKVGREKHRMEAFVRFRLTKDDIYFAIIEPDFNVIPIIKKHFISRYADQKWLIYDLKRKFGCYYDLNKTEYVSMELPEDLGCSGGNSQYFDPGEIYFQKLWKEYFEATNIKSRANMRLHVQHVPKRYWKYLSEKSPFT